jgi:hypothetical protein
MRESLHPSCQKSGQEGALEAEQNKSQKSDRQSEDEYCQETNEITFNLKNPMSVCKE